jgi:hypothetical protein
MSQWRGNATRSTRHQGIVWLIGVLLVLLAITVLVTTALAHRGPATPVPLSPWINELGQVAQILMSRGELEWLYR